MQRQSMLLLRRVLAPQAGLAQQGAALARQGFRVSDTEDVTSSARGFGSTSQRDEQQPLQGPAALSAASISPQVLRAANLLSCAPQLGLTSSSFASRPVISSQARSLSTLVRRGPAGLPALPGKASALLPRTQARTYLTEGEVFGTVYQFTTGLMFWAGIVGAAAFRRNLIVLLLSSEIVMLACNMNFLFASAYLDDITGVIMSITITTIAACETAIGLALCVAYFHMRSAIDVEALNLLK